MKLKNKCHPALLSLKIKFAKKIHHPSEAHQIKAKIGTILNI